jgi:hypothetical protein
MANRLFVAVLGHRKAGKSTTWNELFRETVRTGKHPRMLEFKGSKCAEVFLISASNEERRQYAGAVLRKIDCRIILCSVQYIEAGRQTFEYAVENGFDIYVQWLNPGYNDPGRYFDYLGFVNPLLDAGATLSMRDGSRKLRSRVREIREFIHGWAQSRSLLVDRDS